MVGLQLHLSGKHNNKGVPQHLCVMLCVRRQQVCSGCASVSALIGFVTLSKQLYEQISVECGGPGVRIHND